MKEKYKDDEVFSILEEVYSKKQYIEKE